MNQNCVHYADVLLKSFGLGVNPVLSHHLSYAIALAGNDR